MFVVIHLDFVNVIIATIDKVFIIPITDMELLCSYYVIAGIFIIIAARSHVKDIQNDKRKDKILHCSPSTFDTYVKLGIIPPGHKEVGFKELSWSEKDFDEATLNKVRKYSSKKGL